MQRCSCDFTARHSQKAVWSQLWHRHRASRQTTTALQTPLMQSALGFCAGPAKINTRFKADGLLQTQARPSSLSVSEGEPRQLPQLCKSWSSNQRAWNCALARVGPEGAHTSCKHLDATISPTCSCHCQPPVCCRSSPAGWKARAHGNLQRINVSVPVPCHYERNNSWFFTFVSHKFPRMVLFCAFLCLSQVEQCEQQIQNWE